MPSDLQSLDNLQLTRLLFIMLVSAVRISMRSVSDNMEPSLRPLFQVIFEEDP